MNQQCMMCGSAVKVTVWRGVFGRPVFCPPDRLSGCIATFKARTEDPPDEDEVPHPDAIPPDDIDVCPRCEGAGEVVVRQDWETGGLDTEPCRPCAGTGQVRAEVFA